MPSLDKFFNKNPFFCVGRSFDILIDFSVQAIKHRQTGSDKEHTEIDLLDRFFEVQANSASKVSDKLVLSWVMNNVRAGSDTIASTLSGIVYMVLKNPAVLEKLQKELDSASVTAPVSWKKTQALPYLGAVIQEGLRLHPAIGLALERIVPKGGLTLPDGRFIAEKTIVGMNPWVLHHNQDVFGADTDSFVPERWLIQDEEEREAFDKRRAGMMAAMMSFGGGKRVCMGSNLALLEMHKLVATLFAVFDVGLRTQPCGILATGVIVPFGWMLLIAACVGELCRSGAGVASETQLVRSGRGHQRNVETSRRACRMTGTCWASGGTNLKRGQVDWNLHSRHPSSIAFPLLSYREVRRPKLAT